jgi:NTE family protein
LLFGASNFFKPRVPPLFLCLARDPSTLSFYDFAPLKDLLARLVDFDLLNSRACRFSVGAVNVRTGNFTYFDNTTH